MTAIPFGLVGAVFGHWVTGHAFTLMSLIGVVGLAGIVVNDGLILVDFANTARRSGMRARDAVAGAARSRLPAILLTIAGLAPLMLETSFQAQFMIPMAISLVHGLAFATVLTLFLPPTFYLVFEDARAFARWVWTGHYARRLPVDPAFDPPEAAVWRIATASRGTDSFPAVGWCGPRSRAGAGRKQAT